MMGTRWICCCYPNYTVSLPFSRAIGSKKVLLRIASLLDLTDSRPTNPSTLLKNEPSTPKRSSACAVFEPLFFPSSPSSNSGSPRLPAVALPKRTSLAYHLRNAGPTTAEPSRSSTLPSASHSLPSFKSLTSAQSQRPSWRINYENLFASVQRFAVTCSTCSKRANFGGVLNDVVSDPSSESLSHPRLLPSL
jgi:hypothetical protein